MSHSVQLPQHIMAPSVTCSKLLCSPINHHLSDKETLITCYDLLNVFILTHPNLYISHPAAPPKGGILQISSVTVGRSRMSPGPPSNVCSPPSTFRFPLPTCRAPPAARRSPSPSTPFAAQSGSLSVDGPEKVKRSLNRG